MRATDLGICEKGQEAGIKTYILMSPTIYGVGSGHFNRTSLQIDTIMRIAQRDGFTPLIGNGAEEWSHVHIEDLVKLYETLIAGILSGADLPSNKKGIYFNETGHHSWREVSEHVATAGKRTGYLETDEVRELSLEDGAAALGWPATIVELAFASRSRTRADLARSIGWKPTKTRQDFEDSFATEWGMIGEESKHAK
jgi:nucleoside-diphosphate-sugar epimerase